MQKLQRKQYCWTMDENAVSKNGVVGEGYCCVFEYVRRHEADTHDEEVRLEFDNPNAAISFHKLLIEAGYKFKQVDIVTRPAWAVQ